MSQNAVQHPAVKPPHRPLYIRKVPEEIWNRVHINAIHSRLRLSEYLVKLLEVCEPFDPTPVVSNAMSPT